KSQYPQFALNTYAIMFMVGGSVGIIGAFVLARVKEPISIMRRENMFKLFKQPLCDGNFQRLLAFNSAWVFALSIATPFFTVFMMKSLNLSLSYIIGLTILSQLASIFTIRMWGIY